MESTQEVVAKIGEAGIGLIPLAIPLLIAFAMARLIMWPIRPKSRVIAGAVMVSYGLLIISFWDMSVLANFGWAVGWIIGGYPVLFKWVNNPTSID